MKQLFQFIALIFLFIHLTSNAQSTIQQDGCVDPLLKQVEAERPGLIMFSRKADRGQYVNMAVLIDSTRTLTWFTCHGQAFDVVRLTDDVYSKIKSGDLNPFNYYKDYFFDLLSNITDAATHFRQKGQAALKDTASIYHRVYTYPPVQQARSMLQKEAAMEKLMSDLYLQLSLFDCRTPQQLHPSESFQLRLQLAGKMIRKGDTTTYYNINPLSSAARIVLCKQAPDKMFVYEGQGQLADSVPLKADKYATLLNEKEDVFLLYRGWLELQSQQAIAGKEEVARLLNREHTMLYKPVYWEQNKQHLQRTLLEVQERVDAIGRKVMGLIVPPQEETAQLLAAIYRDKPTEISYIPGLGFAYSVVYIRGHKRYELTNHLGNVMAVLSDRKKAVDENRDGNVEYYNADVVNAADYLPFGGQMPGRAYSGNDKYRYGFNGKENDNEVKGEGNQQDYGMRIYDPRVGRFLSVDPLTKNYPWYTPYQFAGNTPIQAIDLDGAEEFHFAFIKDNDEKPVLTYVGQIDIVDHVLVGYRNGHSLGNDAAVPVYETRTNQRKTFTLHTTYNEPIDKNGGLNPYQSQEWKDFDVRVFFGSYEDMINGRNGRRSLADMWTISYQKYQSMIGPENAAMPALGAGNVRRSVSAITTLEASAIRFTQTSVNGLEEIITSMRKSGWKGAAIDVVKMRDGILSSVDNTRVLAAQITGTKVEAVVHAYDEIIPASQAERFVLKKTGAVPKTWGEAIEFRVQNQSATFRNNNPSGSVTQPKVKTEGGN